MPKIIPLHRIQQINYLRSLASFFSPGQSDRNTPAEPSSEENLWSKIEQAIQLLEQAAPLQLGPTPRELIWRKNKSRLYRYTSGGRRMAIPLFIMYGLINKPTILDLTEQESLIRYLVQEGFAVYLLDWGSFGREDSTVGFSTLLLNYLPRAIRAMQVAEGQPAYHLLGYCMGGTLASIWTAWATGQTELAPVSLSLLASPIDFSQTGLIGKWLSPERFDVSSWVDQVGNVPGEWFAWGNTLMRPYENFFLPLKQLIQRGEDPVYFLKWLALDTWLHEHVEFPQMAFVDWIRSFYQQNQLINHQFKLDGELIRLDRITCPLMVIIAEKDKLVSPAQVEPIITAVSSQTVEQLAVPTGHINLVIGSTAKDQVWPALVKWLQQHS